MLSWDYSFAWTPWLSPISPTPWDYFLYIFTLYQSQKSDIFQELHRNKVLMEDTFLNVL